MKFNQYKFKFYLNASHSIYLGGILGQKHPHTWEITLDTIKVRDDFVQFNDVEKSAEGFLSKYQDSYINDIEPFNTLNPMLENICEYFKDCFQNQMFESGWILMKIEISETPARSYIIDLTDDEEFEEMLFQQKQNNESPVKTIDDIAELELDKIMNIDKKELALAER